MNVVSNWDEIPLFDNEEAEHLSKNASQLISFAVRSQKADITIEPGSIEDDRSDTGKIRKTGCDYIAVGSRGWQILGLGSTD